MNLDGLREKLNKNINNIISKTSPQLAEILTTPIKPKQALYGILMNSLLTAGCGEIPNKEYAPKKGNEPVEIVTKQLPQGVVGQEYSAKIETNPPHAECLLISNQNNGLYIENNELKGNPFHMSNNDVGLTEIKIRCEAEGFFPAEHTLIIEICSGDFFRYADRKFSHIQWIDPDNDGIAQVVLLLQKGTLPDYEPNDSSLERMGYQAEVDIKALLGITGGTDIPSTMPVPVEIQMGPNTSCPYMPDTNAYIGGSNLICIQRVIPTTIMHEYIHEILNSHYSTNMQERIAHSIADSYFGSKTFCELEDGWNHNLFKHLCQQFGVDIDSMQTFFVLSRAEFESKPGFYTPNKPMSPKTAKCIADYIANKIDNKTNPENPTDYDKNTYDIFVQDVCTGQSNEYCNLVNPESYFYIPPEPCVPEVIPESVAMQLQKQEIIDVK